MVFQIPIFESVMIIISIMLLMLVLLCCCYLPAFVVFHDHSKPLTFAHAWIYTAVGFGGLAVLGICCKASDLDMRISALPGILISAYGIKMFRLSCIPRISLVGMNAPGSLFAILASVIGFLYIFIPGIRMGLGDYPASFFNVDTSIYLAQVHSLMRYDTWPPPSLWMLGEAVGYHYGSQVVCAVLSSLTGVAPHIIAFLVYAPIVQLAAISTAWLIVGCFFPLSGSLSACRCGVPFIMFGAYYPIVNLLSFPMHPSLDRLLQLFPDPQAYGGGYPMLSSLFGVFASLASVYCVQRFSSAACQRLLVFLVGVMIVFKSPYFIVLGAGFGLWTLFEIRKTHQYSLIWGPVLSLGVAFCLYTMSMQATGFTTVIVPGQLSGAELLLLDVKRMFGVYSMAGVLTIVTLGKAVGHGYAWRYIVCYCLPALAFVNLFGITRAGKLGGDLFQVLGVLPLFVGMFTLTLVLENWRALKKLIQVIVVMILVLAILPPLGHRAYHTWGLIVAPETEHEYVDNRALAQALLHIPVKGSLIVTSDFRYPAQKYRRDLQQMQFPALFGHQMYASHFAGRNADSETQRVLQDRLALQLRFRNDPWDVELEHIAKEKGWTHLVIHLGSPHASKIPLPLLFENEMYQVYRFKHVNLSPENT